MQLDDVVPTEADQMAIDETNYLLRWDKKTAIAFALTSKKQLASSIIPFSLKFATDNL